MFKPPAWLWRQAGQVGWWVLPGWEDSLLGPAGLRLREWQDEGRLSVVKRSPQRVVYRVDLPERAVYIKHYLIPGPRELFRQWFRRGKGRNEGKRAERLAQLGIDTIEPVALGEQRRRRFLFENYLVSPAIEGVVPLDRFVETELPAFAEPLRSRVARDLARALGELTARQHDAGLEHVDYHPGNLLVRLDDAGRPHLAMIDLDALRFHRSLSPARRAANLALLNHYFWIRCGRAHRARFLKAYLAATSWKADPAGLARSIERRTRSWAERLWRRWGRRCLGTNKYFHKHRTDRGWAIASRSIDPALARALLDDPEAPWRDPSTVVLKESRTTRVGETTWTVDGAPARVIYKRFNRKRWYEPLQALFRPSRGWRSWRAGHHLASRGLPTPDNLLIVGMIGRTRFLPAPISYLATIKVEPSTTLADYLRRGLPAEGRRPILRRLAEELARLLRTIHDRSISDRDLKASNILVVGDPASGDFRLSLIDLVGATLRHPLPRDRRVQNLSRLAISLSEADAWNRPDTLRLLRAYLGPTGHDPAILRRWWSDLTRRGLRKRRQNERRGRLLS
jgi:tRNA A-37 threonylcarbamoyl transferase component Bud32